MDLKNNIVFLDIDGVLNTLMIDTKPFESSGQISRDGFYYELCFPEDKRVSNRQAVMWLNKLCKETNAKIVISSTWRMGINGFKLTKEALRNTGLLEEIEIIGQTEILNQYDFNIRGREIENYLDNHPEINRYVILDDDNDMLPNQINHLVQTDTDYGFGYKDYLKAKQILEED